MLPQGNGEIEKYLKALAHRVRRDIIRALAEKGRLSYSELMRITGVMDSGTFAFHIRMLQGLIEKDPGTGDYRLTGEGWRAYRALKLLMGEEAAVGTSSGAMSVEQVIRIGDMPELVFTRRFAEKLRREGRRVIISDVSRLTIEDMSEELLDSVVKGIYDVDLVIAPKHLHHIIILKSRDVSRITDYEDHEDSSMGLASPVSGSIRYGLSKALSKAIGFHGRNIPVHMYADKPSGKPGLSITIDTSSLTIHREGERIELKGEYSWGGDASLSTTSDRVNVYLNTFKGDLILPGEYGALELVIDTSSVRGELVCSSIGSSVIDTSKVDLVIKGLDRGRGMLRLDTSNGTLKLYYGGFKGESSLEIDADTSNMAIEIYLPENIALDISIAGDTGEVIVDGFRGASYRDKDYDSAESRLVVRGYVDTGKVRIVVHRGES